MHTDLFKAVLLVSLDCQSITMHYYKQEGQDGPVSLICVPDKFWVNWPFCSGQEVQNRFLVGTMLAIFALQITQILPTKFAVDWPFGSGEKFKIDSQDNGHDSHLGFLIGTI